MKGRVFRESEVQSAVIVYPGLVQTLIGALHLRFAIIYMDNTSVRCVAAGIKVQLWFCLHLHDP